MLIQISATLTEGETPSAVFINPWTIHGWRPFSVSIQPAVFMRNGVNTAQIAARWNHRAVSRRRAGNNHAPHNASSPNPGPRYPIPRNHQYRTKTFGM